MTTAATITANLVLNSGEFQRGMKQAKTATADFQRKYEAMVQRVAKSSEIFQSIGDGLTKLGGKMTRFITLPIAGFFALIVAKAMEADTAIAKMAKDSLSKLNEQLVVLGTKFLPLVIKAIDGLTKALDWFNKLPPGMQTTITMIVAMVALAGPILTFVGAISKVISAIQALRLVVMSLQITLSTSLIPTIASVGTAIWAALLPLLPIIALILAAILLVYLVWKNWDQLGTTISQLGQILVWAIEETLKDIIGIIGDVKTSWTKMAADMKLKWDAMAAKIILANTSMFIKINAKFNEFKNWAINTWNAVGNAFRVVFSAIANFANSVFQSIVNGIQWVIGAVQDLIAALGDIVLPDELTPGSPTPFEVGLRGIAQAMDNLSGRSIPQLSRSFAPSGISEVGGGRVINYTDNRRFGAGVTVDVIKMAMDNQFGELTRLIENG